MLNVTIKSTNKNPWRGLIAILVIIIIGISLLLLTLPGKVSQLSIYSDDWNDLSKLRNGIVENGYNVSHINSNPIYLREVNDPRNTVFVVIGLERDYTQPEVDAIAQYIADGGNLIIADDFSYGNSLIKKLDNSYGNYLYYGYYDVCSMDYEFSGQRVVDIQYYKDPNLIMVNTATVDKYKLLLNSPTAIIERRDVEDYSSKYFKYNEVLAQTSSLSWLDDNKNYTRDTGEPEGPFPIVMRFSRFSSNEYDYNTPRFSNIYLISDPSLFINEMWDSANNSDFALYLINDALEPGGEVIFDESVHLTEVGVTDLGNSFYSLIIYFYFNPGILFFIIFIISFAIILISIRESGKTKKIKFQRHQDILDSKKLFTMHRSELSRWDYGWIRAIFMEKVRISYDLPYEFFYSYSKDQLTDLIQNQMLLDFIFSPHPWMFDVDFLKSIVKQIMHWEPDPEVAKMMSDIIKRSEEYSVADSTRAQVVFKKLDLEDLEKKDGALPIYDLDTTGITDNLEQSKKGNW